MTEKTKEILKKHLMQAKADRNYFTNSYLEISIDAPEQERKDTFERHLKYTAIYEAVEKLVADLLIEDL